MAGGATGQAPQPPFDPDAIPDGATLTHGGAALRLTWPDGVSAALPARLLRLRCRCAWCTRDRAQDRFPQDFPGIAVTQVAHMGTYAVHVAFSDGHARGIFPWVYLRALADETADARPAASQAA